jgi:ElaB/YqjD/DUF883 family membrane-anchored ribosome-binding protein
MSCGLRECLGLGDLSAPAVDRPAALERFRSAFLAEMGEIGRCLQYTAAYSSGQDHAKIDAQRQLLYRAYQSVATVEPADPSAAEADRQRVMVAAQSLRQAAEQLRQSSQTARDAWSSREGQFEQVVDQIRELQQQGHAKAGTLTKAAELIRSYSQDRRFNESARALDQVAPKVAALHAQVQQPADPGVAEASAGSATAAVGAPGGGLREEAGKVLDLVTSDPSVVGTGRPIELPGESRKLTDDEIARAKRIYGDRIDYSQITIHSGSVGSYGSTRTLGNGIHFTPNKFKEGTMELSDAGLKTLMHELEHVHQYQSQGWGYAVESLWEQGKAAVFEGDRNHAYEWKEAEAEGLDAENWNVEEQAAAIEDYDGYLERLQAIKDGKPAKPLSPEEQQEMERLKKHVDRILDREPKGILDRMEEAIEETADELYQDAKELYDEADEAVSEVIDDATEAAEELYRDAEELYDEADEAVSEVIDDATEAAEELCRDAEELYDEADEAVSEVIDDATEAAEDLYRDAEEVYQEAEELYQQADEAVSEAAEEVVESLDDAVEAADEAIEAADEAIDEAVEDASDWAEEKASDAREAFDDGIDEIRSWF